MREIGLPERMWEHVSDTFRAASAARDTATWLNQRG